ncbi:MAG: epoxyqueuosine reductase QueH [Clostridia bacterium]|nr:epoxyqueuosine reductase QueH [Clostridia bacterium]
MNKVNYQREMEAVLARLAAQGRRPRLLLHSCCGPCSSAVLETLAPHFALTVFFCNPNIYPEDEYRHRLAEQARLLAELPFEVSLLEDPYDHAAFLSAVRGLEREPEGGARCEPCFRLRMERAARAAHDGSFDFFTTTLSVSPHKDAQLLGAIGQELGARYGVAYLPSDFKKKEGYKRSVALAKQYALYRQDYCGCEFSQNHDESKG